MPSWNSDTLVTRVSFDSARSCIISPFFSLSFKFSSVKLSALIVSSFTRSSSSFSVWRKEVWLVTSVRWRCESSCSRFSALDFSARSFSIHPSFSCFRMAFSLLRSMAFSSSSPFPLLSMPKFATSSSFSFFTRISTMSKFCRMDCSDWSSCFKSCTLLAWDSMSFRNKSASVFSLAISASFAPSSCRRSSRNFCSEPFSSFKSCRFCIRCDISV
mmetsp:Transcript_2265/g.5347  ORF Transcript_2265/g.5347 Transcript_2265/m.5347 type:complete len:215 (+) Transcript_2265:2400-3044(+)